MKPSTTRRFRPFRPRGPENLEDRCLLSGVTAVQDFVRLDPAGSLVYASTDNPGELTGPADQADFQFFAQAGEKLSLVATPRDPVARLSLSLVGGGLSATAAGPGQPVVLPAGVASSGISTLRVTSDTAATFSVDVVRGAAVELSSGDSSTANPVDLAPSLFENRYALLGSTSLVGPLTTVFAENFDGAGQTFSFDNDYSSGAGLWHASQGRAADGLAGHSPPGSIYFGQAELPPAATLQWQAAVAAPELAWGPTVVGTGGSAYYLNDNVVDGNVLGARITYGPYEQDRTGAVVHALPTGEIDKSAKSAARVGDYVYFTGDSGGVYRTQVANTATPWTSYEACTISNSLPLETLATDGTRLYASTTTVGDEVQAYSVDTATGALTLVWSTTGIAGRVRGLDWDSSGYIYATDGGEPAENVLNNSAHLYAIEAATGAVTDMGTVTFNGRLYQTVRHGNQILLFDSFTGSGAPAGQVYVYDLAGNTQLVSTTPAQIYDPPGIGRIFGAAIDGGRMWLTSNNGQTFGYTVDNNVWESDVNNTALTEWTFAGDSAPLSSPAANLAGVDAWYHLPPAATMASLQTSQGDAVTKQDVTWEFVFRPTDFSGTHVLFETGGNADGTAFVLLDDTLEFRVQDADSATQRVVKSVTFDAIADVNLFHHVVATVHTDATAALNEVRLYVDGVEVGVPAGAPGVLADWSDADGAGLGAPNGQFAGSSGTPTPTPFDGDIALLRFYGNQRFNPGQAQANYDALVAPAAFRTGNYDTGTAVAGEAASPVVALPASGTLTLSFDTLVQVEESVEPFELLRVVVKNTATQAETTLFDRFEGSIPADTLGQWLTLQADLTPFAGQNVEILFRFDSGDALGNGFEGWYVDNVQITQLGPAPASDVDEYAFHLSGDAVRPVDVVLAGRNGLDFSGQTLQLLDAGGTAVLATAPLASPAPHYDLAILGWPLAGGDYRVRLTSSLVGDYTLLVTDSVALESEPNDLRTDPLRDLNGSGAGLGFLNSSAVQVYTTRSSFNAANPGLPLEDFQEAVVEADSLATFFGPLDSTSSNDVFQPGDIRTGLTVSAQDASGATLPEGDLAAVGASFLGSGVPGRTVVGPNEAADHTRLTFSPGVFAVGLDVFDLAAGPVAVYVYAAADNLLLATSVDATSSGTFFGLASNTAIDHIRLDSSGFELVGSIAFGASGVTLQPDGDWHRLAGLEVGQMITISTRTPLDDPANQPLNDLDPELLVVDAAGATVVADQDSGLDGKNARASFFVSTPGDYFVRVGVQGGSGEYVVERASQSNLDADGNGSFAPLTDGILIIRYLFDQQGAWSVDDALGAASTRTTRAQIKNFLDGARNGALDADGNGTADALSDGILILRYLFDPDGTWPVDDALAPGATRTTQAEIKAYLDQYYQAAGAAPPGAALRTASPPADFQATLSAAILLAADTSAGPLLDPPDGAAAESALLDARSDTQALDAVLLHWAQRATVTAAPTDRPQPSALADPLPTTDLPAESVLRADSPEPLSGLGRIDL